MPSYTELRQYVHERRFPHTRWQYALAQAEKDGFKRPADRMDFQEFIKSDPKLADAFLREKTFNLNEALNILDFDAPPYFIFNRHDHLHSDRVNEIAHNLLDLLGDASPIEHTIVSTIAYLHDLGNLVRRKGHEKISQYFFYLLFQNFEETDPIVQSILQGIDLHNESSGLQLEDYAKIETAHRRSIWAVAAADKMDMAENRLSKHLSEGEDLPAPREELVEKYPHMLIPLYTHDARFTFTSPTTAEFRVSFSTDSHRAEDSITQEIQDRFTFIRKSSRRKSTSLWVLTNWYDLSREHQDRYVHRLRALLTKLYAGDFAIMLSSIFALFEKLETVDIVVRDSNPQVRAYSGTTYDRNTWKNQIFFDWKQIYKAKHPDEDVTADIVPPLLFSGYLADQARIENERLET